MSCLKMVFLLYDEGIVDGGEVEALVGHHQQLRRRQLLEKVMSDVLWKVGTSSMVVFTFHRIDNPSKNKSCALLVMKFLSHFLFCQLSRVFH